MAAGRELQSFKVHIMIILHKWQKYTSQLEILLTILNFAINWLLQNGGNTNYQQEPPKGNHTMNSQFHKIRKAKMVNWAGKLRVSKEIFCVIYIMVTINVKSKLKIIFFQIGAILKYYSPKKTTIFQKKIILTSQTKNNLHTRFASKTYWGFLFA